ncbi:phosphodiester glycosidase family protein [Clostridium lundense]|uniref:phosphodiester glycosidase family protein n=1 Tax=Clostridium lundense TaxID=319475 RepID=UPI00048934AC|nr:phosphodiester glycosidase family protein [Clostridium lundense]
MNKRSEKKKKKKFSFKLFGLFMLYEIIFVAITSPLLVFHGPFKNVKKILVGTAMYTFKHQYIATLFLPQEEINKVLNKENKEKKVEKIEQNFGDIKIQNVDDNSIVRYNIHQDRFDGYLLEIKNPKKVKVGYTDKMKIQGQRVSEIAERNGAIAAINGGGFYDQNKSGKQWVGTGAFPEGIVISEGKEIWKNVKEDEEVDVMAFKEDGELIVGKRSLRELREKNVKEALSFNRTLIMNGQPLIENYGEQGLQPRTVIGQKQDGTVVFVVIDGRKLFKEGADLKQVQDILLKQGVWNAGNLDGGSSSTMYYKGEVINNPCNRDGERTVATVFYVEP